MYCIITFPEGKYVGHSDWKGTVYSFDANQAKFFKRKEDLKQSKLYKRMIRNGQKLGIYNIDLNIYRPYAKCVETYYFESDLKKRK